MSLEAREREVMIRFRHLLKLGLAYLLIRKEHLTSLFYFLIATSEQAVHHYHNEFTKPLYSTK
jgi:hypothetical protein